MAGFIHKISPPTHPEPKTFTEVVILLTRLICYNYLVLKTILPLEKRGIPIHHLKEGKQAKNCLRKDNIFNINRNAKTRSSKVIKTVRDFPFFNITSVLILVCLSFDRLIEQTLDFSKEILVEMLHSLKI